MANLCKQCSIEMYGEDHHDFKGKDESWLVICDCCGLIQVDKTGKCISLDCLEDGHK